MTITKKIVWIGVAQLSVLGGVLIAAYYFEARREIVQQYVEKSRAIVLTAESTREEMGRKWAQGIFTTPMLADWARRGETDKVVSAVPVVTAWRAAMEKSAEGGYTLRVPKFQPRNPRNEPDATEARVLRLFEQRGVREYYEIDGARNAIRYFRPIRLTSECLNCHGDPATSSRLWGNDQGRDPTGGPMENWKVGEVHGAFEVVQSLGAAQAAVAHSMWIGAAVVTGLVVLSAAVFFVLISRQVVRPVAQIVDGLATGATQVAEVAAQVAHSAQDLATGASEQAASLEETSASMEEMSSMTRTNATHTQRAAALIKDVDTCVAASIAELDAMVTTMTSIQESSGRVARIIKTIDEIAFQTNILALNAAVEAARAGDLGSGFAVVADEVRTLAQRSAEAAHDTSSLIENAAANASHGTSRVHDLEQAVRGITESVARVRQLVDDIQAGSAQQAQGSSHIGQALQQMEQITQGNAAAAEESAAASEQLSAQADVTRGLVETLRRLVGVAPMASGVGSAAAGRRMPPLSAGVAGRQKAA